MALAVPRLIVQVFLLVGLLCTGVLAQPVSHPIVILNQDVLFNQSNFGLRVQNNLTTLSGELSTENREIEAELEAEELALTEQRPGLNADEFRALADAFDVKVEIIRQAQGQKAVDLETWAVSERQRFFQEALPLLVAFTRSLGADVVLDSRTVVLATDNIDITQAAINHLNDTLGDGAVPDE